MKKEKSELIQEALDTLQAVTLSGRSTEGYVAELFEDIRNLEEENKKLKEYNGELIENHKKDIDILCKENKKLNIKVASLEGEIKGLNYTIEKLREENQTLELWLDNKEKVNKKLKEDVDYFRQCYLDLKKLCEKEGFMLSDEEVTKMFNLDKIK